MAIHDLIELKTQLDENWVRIEFTKIDGTLRSMLCTRNFVEIPNDQKPSGTKKAVNESVLNVFDLEKQAWRSIRVDNILRWIVDRSVNGKA